MLNGEAATPLPSVSVCILTANRTELLRELLQALLSQLQPDDEVVVLDTDPADANHDLVDELASPAIKYHKFEMEQFDFATARNKLLKLATCSAAVFIDDDALPFPGWLEQVKQNLLRYDAVGGVTVSSAQLPDWWDPDINWCIGLSPPGTILGMPGYYPDTCNLGADKNLWNRQPLAIISRENRQLYSTGREDAEWWLERRRQGENISVSFRQAVVHTVHPDRLSLDYVVRRARLDGESSWLRRPTYEGATAIPWDLAHIAGVVSDNIIKHPFNRRFWINDYIWLNRQWGRFHAVWNSPLEQRPRHGQLALELGKAAAFQVKIRASKAVFETIKVTRSRKDFPATIPDKLFVSADCLMGDSLLLRPHITSLAKTFPACEIIVSARSPQLLAGLPENVNVMPVDKASAHTLKNLSVISAAFVPYFYEGDYRLWRKHLSAMGSTFDSDVGFRGRRDYIYARRQVVKNLELHEHENLAKLFRLWPLQWAGYPAGPPIADHHQEWLATTLTQNSISKDYILVQFGAGYASKEWPVDCWIPFLRDFARKANQPLVIIGTAQWQEAGDIAARELGDKSKCLNLAGRTNLDELMALVHGASFLVGGCSGPKHLAIDFQVPTFTLYTATEPERWGASRDHELHAYVTALPQKLTSMELHGLRDDHRARLLNPEQVAERALKHYFNVTRREQIRPSDELSGSA